MRLDEVSWDDPDAAVPLAVHLTPQEAINRVRPKPRKCDFVVVILWSRIGTALPSDYRKPDGKPYASGTQWEYLDAVAAADRLRRQPEDMDAFAQRPSNAEFLLFVDQFEELFSPRVAEERRGHSSP